MSGAEIPSGSRQLFNSEGDYQHAIDEVLANVGRELRLFDRDLARLRLNDPVRIEHLTRFLSSGTTQRLQIVVHDPSLIERQTPRLVSLLRRFSPAIEFRQSPENLRHLADCLLLADKQDAVVRFHYDQPRGKALRHAAAEVHPYWQRFGELWDLSEPCLTATVLGL